MSPTLEELEGIVWGPPEFQSGLVIRCHQLWKKPIAEFSIADLQVMIGQKFGLLYLLPRAVEILDREPLAEGDYYPGDLLSSVMAIDIDFWKSNETLACRLVAICKRAMPLLTEDDRSININCTNFVDYWASSKPPASSDA